MTVKDSSKSVGGTIKSEHAHAMTYADGQLFCNVASIDGCSPNNIPTSIASGSDKFLSHRMIELIDEKIPGGLSNTVIVRNPYLAQKYNLGEGTAKNWRRAGHFDWVIWVASESTYYLNARGWGVTHQDSADAFVSTAMAIRESNRTDKSNSNLLHGCWVDSSKLSP